MILVEIAGFLGADAEVRYTASGKKVISLRIATRVRQGGKDETVWWRVNIWGDRFDKLLPHLKKGAAVIVLGDMAKPEIYTGKDGVAQISLTLNAEIIKFSPFGRPERSGNERERSNENPMQMAPSLEEPVFSHASSSKSSYNLQEEGFTGDDLPF